MKPATARKFGLLTSLYLSQGLPFGFFTQALPVLLRASGADLGKVTLTNLLSLPWGLKFLWAPLLDRPGLSRRTVIVPLQLLTVAVLLATSFLDPKDGFSPILAAVFMVNVLAASQDIATDALAVDLLAVSERGLGNSIQVAGYRAGMVIGGGALLVVFEQLGWQRSFLLMAAVLGLATLPIAFTKEAPRPVVERREGPEGGGVREAFRSWIGRPGIGPWLVLLLTFKSGDYLATGVMRPFLHDLGLGLEELGWSVGTLGFLAGLVGAVLGGIGVTRLGRRRALVGFGALQALSIGTWAIAALGVPRGVLYGLIALEHLAGGMATAALFTAMMDVCRKERGATDYTVQACVVVGANGVASALSGSMAQALGYPLHFAVAMVAALGGVAWVALYRERDAAFALLPAGAGHAEEA